MGSKKMKSMKTIPYWENASWEHNEGEAHFKKSYFSRSLAYLFNKKEVNKVERVQTMCMSSIYSGSNTFDTTMPPRRTKSFDYGNLVNTIVSRSPG